MGRPSKYKPEYCRIAYQMALLGATDEEFANAFDTTEQTINNWKQSHPEFFESLKNGKDIADSEVAKRLYERAMGYEHKDLYITQYQGTIIKEKIMKYFPPDTTAAIFWLKNRQPDKWRDSQNIDYTSKGDKIQPLEISVTKENDIQKYKEHLKKLGQLN